MTEQMQMQVGVVKPTQKRRVLALLRMAGEAGICIANVPLALSYTARNRISELRHEGYVIDSAHCTVHNHHAAVARYTLREEPHGRG